MGIHLIPLQYWRCLDYARITKVRLQPGWIADPSQNSICLFNVIFIHHSSFVTTLSWSEDCGRSGLIPGNTGHDVGMHFKKASKKASNPSNDSFLFAFPDFLINSSNPSSHNIYQPGGAKVISCILQGV